MNLPAEAVDGLRARKGLIATCVTTGTVESQFSQCREDMRSFHDRNGFVNIEYKQFDAKLVEAGRDAAAEHFLGQPSYEWMLQIDADATFSPDSVVRILHTAFNVVADSDIVGAYCQLKAPPLYSPTIDTGTGTWEPHFPGEGVLPVIRTGAHFILCKRSAFEKIGKAPYFRTRHAPRALDMLYEVDGFARQNFSGTNPLWGEEWDRLLDKAAASSDSGASSVGEDSGICDRLKAAGGTIYVDTNIVTGHIGKRVISPNDLKKGIADHEHRLRLVTGILE